MKIACAAALSLGISVTAVGAVVGLRGGLITIIGGLAIVYAADRPYRYRAILLGGIVVALTIAACLGAWAHHRGLVVIPVIAAVAMVTTFFSHALRIGPPGAYLFALACVLGDAVGAHFGLWQIALFGVTGGVISWLIQMSGALVDPRGPEIAAVVASARAVATFADRPAGPDADRACDDVAQILHDGWIVLVSLQPASADANRQLARLRALHRDLHVLFAQCLDTIDSPETESRAAYGARAQAIIGLASQPVPDGASAAPLVLPLGQIAMPDSIRESLARGSTVLATTFRVGVGVACAGAIGATLELQRINWAMAAAVLVLHQGLGWRDVARRGIGRMVGTLAGLGLVAALLLVHPGGVLLVGLLMALQFATEMMVKRSYAIAVVFITAMALLAGNGGQSDSMTQGLLWARGEETMIGCLTGMAVYVVSAARHPATIRNDMAKTIRLIGALVTHLADGNVSTVAARIVRRDLLRAMFALVARFDMQFGAKDQHTPLAASLWPAVVATRRLGYKVLALCWSHEAKQAAEPAASPEPAGGTGHSRSDATITRATLESMAQACAQASAPAVSAGLPPLLRTEILALNAALAEGPGTGRA